MATQELPKLEIVDRKIILDGKELESIREFEIKGPAEGKPAELWAKLLVRI